MSANFSSDTYFSQIAASDCLFSRLLEKRARTTPDRLFFSFGEAAYTFATFNRRANRMARCLLEAGITRGTVVAVLMETTPDYLTLWFALGKIGAVEVPINTAYRSEILRHQLATSAATVCVVDARFAAGLSDIVAETLVKKVFVSGDSAVAVAGVDSDDFANLLREQPADDLDSAPSYTDIGGIIFTSGTTGPSKGVLLSYRYVTAYGVMYADINGLRDDDVILNFLPFFHMSGKFLTIAALVCGGSMRLQARLSISTFLDEVAQHGVTNFVGVGGICNMLLSRPEQAGDAGTTIRTIYAVPDADAIHHELQRRFNCRITTVFGSTEVGLPLFRGVDDPYRPGSCGRVSPYYDVRIVDAFDNELPAGETGEIVVRPKLPYLVADGYVGMPAKTVEAWRNLWFHSGDAGRCDADGYFYFEDRVSDSLRRRGENISSFEVELLAARHPQVSEVAAVAYPADVGEDEVRLFVIPRSGQTLTAETLFMHCVECMPYFMVPRYIDIVSEFPRTPTAKVEKYKLRKQALTLTTWDSASQGFRVTRTGLTKTEPVS